MPLDNDRISIVRFTRDRDHIVRGEVQLLANLNALSQDLSCRVNIYSHIFFDKPDGQFRYEDCLSVDNRSSCLDDVVLSCQTAEFAGETRRKSL